jgi:hypothetical protein
VIKREWKLFIIGNSKTRSKTAEKGDTFSGLNLTRSPSREQMKSKLVVHRDFRPGHIMLREDGKVCFISFGILSIDGYETASNHDTYSFGITVVQMLTFFRTKLVMAKAMKAVCTQNFLPESAVVLAKLGCTIPALRGYLKLCGLDAECLAAARIAGMIGHSRGCRRRPGSGRRGISTAW